MISSIIVISILFSIVGVGVYIAHRVSYETKLVVRLILLLPMFSAVADLNLLLAGDLAGDYVITVLDIVREFSILVLYILIGFLLKGSRLLKNIGTLCEREIQAWNNFY